MRERCTASIASRGELTACCQMLLREMAAVIGLGFPPDPPSALEALANGAAFVNPLLTLGDTTVTALRARVSLTDADLLFRDPNTGRGLVPQHRFLAALGPPYVYTVNPRNHSAVVAVAEAAVRQRFASYVPPKHTVESTMSAVCDSLLQDDALCAGRR